MTLQAQWGGGGTDPTHKQPWWGGWSASPPRGSQCLWHRRLRGPRCRPGWTRKLSFHLNSILIFCLWLNEMLRMGLPVRLNYLCAPLPTITPDNRKYCRSKRSCLHCRYCTIPELAWRDGRKSGLSPLRIQLKFDGTRWRTGGEVMGKLANGVGSQYPSHYVGTWCIQHYYRWCTHLDC